MKKLYLALLAASMLLIGNTAAFAAEGLYLGPSLTGYLLDSDRFVSEDDDALVGGLSLGYKFDENWAADINAGTTLSEHEMDVYQTNFYYYFGEDDGSWRPYALAGISYFDSDLSDAPTLKADEDSTMQAQIGVGLTTMITDHWEVRSDVRLYHKIKDGVSNTDDIALNFGMNYYFDAAPSAAPVVEPTPEPVTVVEPQKRTITIRLNVEFEFDKDVVRAIYGDELNAVASAMKEHQDITLVLEGHTDSRGTDSYNDDLSKRRAAAVKAKLVEVYDIAASRISTVGFGESRPIADNATDEGRARNRRVIGEMSYTEIVVD